MRKVLVLAVLFLSGCAAQQASQAPGAQDPTAETARKDPNGPPYPALTPPWLNPAIGSINSDPKAPPVSAAGGL